MAAACAFGVLWLAASSCSSGEQATTPATSQSAQPTSAGNSPASTTGAVAIEFVSEPDPPRSGDNALAVTVRQPDGSPVTDASVTAVFSMPAMPSMNMPAMRSETTLSHVEGGRYNGTGQLSMAGTWNVTVTVVRGSQELGSRRLSLVAK